MPDHLEEVLNDSKASNGDSKPFWLFVAALKRFIEHQKRLPVSGAVPDMISKTDFYLKL